MKCLIFKRLICYFCSMLNKKTGIFIGIFSLSIIGLLWMQFYWISFSFQMKSEEFDTRVNKVLSEIAKEAEESFYCIDFFSEFTVSPGDGVYLIKHLFDENGYLPLDGDYHSDTIPTYFWNQFQNDTLLSYSNIKFSYPANIKMELSVEYLMQENSGFEKNGLTINSYRRSLFENEAFLNTLDTLIVNHFNKNVITSTYQYILQSTSSDSIYYSKPDSINPELFADNLSTVLFNDDYFFSPVKMMLFFPEKKMSLIGELWMLIAGSFILIGILIILIIYFIRTFIHQQRLSAMKSDFISNMTHEFKTPVANINLALDTLENQQMLSGESSQRVAGIIREENQRMRQNIDLILETSLFDKRTIKFKKSEVDIHDLLDTIIDSLELELTEKKGVLTKKFQAEKTITHIDEPHLFNAILNILDNALKYSDRAPEITVSTRNIDKGISISIQDNGIGIPASSLDKIFDKFYRQPHGNQHDVKGFGLGLYYAKQIIGGHHGKINVKSELHEGSRFEIWIPID